MTLDRTREWLWDFLFAAFSLTEHFYRLGPTKADFYFPNDKSSCYFRLQVKLYIPSTINIWKKLLSTAIWADKNGLVSDNSLYFKYQTWDLKQYSNLVIFFPEFIQFRMYFHLKNLKSERNNPWFKPWFNILRHTQSIVCAPQYRVNVLGTWDI